MDLPRKSTQQLMDEARLILKIRECDGCIDKYNVSDYLNTLSQRRKSAKIKNLSMLFKKWEFTRHL